MTIKFNNVYLKETSTVACFDEKKGRFGKMYDKTYDDYYMGCDTFEKAEIKMIHDSINILLIIYSSFLYSINIFKFLMYVL